MKNKYQEFLQLNPEEFDQDEEKGWRKLERIGRHLEAAEAIEAYLEFNKEKLQRGSSDDQELQKLMHFHIGQLLATQGAEHYSKAVHNFKKSYLSNKEEGWNDYVAATIAFLEKDQKSLKSHLAVLKYLKKQQNLSNPNLLTITENFTEALRAGKYSYKDAYQ